RAVVLNNQNNLNLLNNANLGAGTGYNSANKNMGTGTIVSGDADVSFTTINKGNNTFINPDVLTYNITGDQTGDLWINFPADAFGSGAGNSLGSSNVGNGADSTNNASSSATTSTTIDNNNNLVLDNNINIYANTGHNTANKNMGAGDITTGDANV